VINFDKVLNNIFVGTCPTGDLDIKRLQQAGFTAVLNLQTDVDFETHNIDWITMERFYFHKNISVKRVPIIDFNDNDLISNLPTATQTLNHLVEANHRIYVHCTAGKQRSPSTVICYLAWYKKFGLEKSIQLTLTARNCAPPIGALKTADLLYQRNPH